MSTRNILFSVGEYYHIYNRGTDKRVIFLDEADKKRFIKLLFVANGTQPFVFRDFPIGLPYVKFERGDPITAIGAYCLMPNHFHILIKETTEQGISKFLSRILTSYSAYFNKKYKRTGRLFEGPFKSKHIDNEPYFNWIFSYIHLNPVKIINPNWKEDSTFNLQETKSFLSDYSYSSYFDYFVEQRPESVILNKDAFPEHFRQLNDIDTMISEFGNYAA